MLESTFIVDTKMTKSKSLIIYQKADEIVFTNSDSQYRSWAVGQKMPNNCYGCVCINFLCSV